MNNIRTTMGLAMLCGAALSAQASISQFETTYPDQNNTIKSPFGSGFYALSADTGSSLTKTFSFNLTEGDSFEFAVGFLNLKGSGNTLSSGKIDTAGLTVSGPGVSSQDLWDASSATVPWQTQTAVKTVIKNGHSISTPVTTIASKFSGWTVEDFKAPSTGTYTFSLSDSNLGLDIHDTDNAKYGNVACFAAVPEPSTYVAGVIIGAMAAGRFIQEKRNKARKV